MYWSRLLALPILVAASSQGNSAGMVFTREVASGYSKGVLTYRNWDRQCQEIAGVARPVTRPQHGKLSITRVISPIRMNRFRPNDPCIGRTTGGLLVVYTSDPGYRGTDRFVIERTRPTGPTDLDTFIMTVR